MWRSKQSLWEAESFLLSNSFSLLFRGWAKAHFSSFHITYILWLSWLPGRDTDKEKTVKDSTITVRMEVPTACVEREETGLPTDREIYPEQMSFRRKCHKNTFSLLALILGLENLFPTPQPSHISTAVLQTTTPLLPMKRKVRRRDWVVQDKVLHVSI